MSKVTIEICSFSLESALRAQEAGADRIELCGDAGSGGVTPSAGVVATARERLRIKLMVMIRPRGGNFVYSDAELAAMRRDIEFCKKIGVDGGVFGLLDEHRRVDRKRTAELVELARPMEVTFHRAFDIAEEPMRALEDIIECGCSRLLTSGQKLTAPEGADLIAELVGGSRGRVTVMPGCGVRSGNLAELARITGAVEFHSAALPDVEPATDAGTPFGFGDVWAVDQAEVRALRDAADKIGMRK